MIRIRFTTSFRLLIVLLAFSTLSCSAQGNPKPKEDNNSINVKKEKVMGTKHLTKAEFLTKVANYEANPKEWTFLGERPCIVDFYATWCGPCKMIAPILEELAVEYDGKIDIYKIDTEKEEELSAAFGIRSIPTLLFCPMGAAPQLVKGGMSKADFKKAIESVLLEDK